MNSRTEHLERMSTEVNYGQWDDACRPLKSSLKGNHSPPTIYSKMVKNIVDTLFQEDVTYASVLVVNINSDEVHIMLNEWVLDASKKLVENKIPYRMKFQM